MADLETGDGWINITSHDAASRSIALRSVTGRGCVPKAFRLAEFIERFDG